MPMRAIISILVCLTAGLILTAPARAQPRYLIDISVTGDEEDRSRFRRELETSISEFVQSLPQGTRNALGTHDFQETPARVRTHEDARAHWDSENAVLIVIWGRVTAPGEVLRTLGNVYIGFTNGQRSLAHPVDGYQEVLGQVRGQSAQLELFQAMVGYALLLRAWQRGLSREHIDIIATRIERIQPSAVTASTSRCLSRIRAAVASARLKAPLQPLRPGRLAAAPVLVRTCANA